MRTFEFTVDLDHLQSDTAKLIKMLGLLDEALDSAFEEIEQLELAKLFERLSAYGLGSSNLAKTATVTRFRGCFRVSVNSEYAFYVE